MLERAAHRVLRGFEHDRDLLGPEPEHVAQDQDRPLPGRQELQGGDEGERDRLSRLEPRLRAWRRFREVLQQYVGVGLEPDHLAGRGRLRKPRRRRGRQGGPPPRRPQGVEATVGRDPEQPPSHGRPCLKTRDAVPGGQERLLDLVLRILDGAEDPVTVHVELAPMPVDEVAERLLVASLRAGDEIAVHRGFLPATSLPAWVIHSPM